MAPESLGKEAMSDFTRTLARFVIETPENALPDEVLQRAHTAVVDTIGCALAGWTEQAPNVALDHARFLGATGCGTVWGRGVRTAPVEAAFVNGVAAHVLDFDDSLPGLRAHPTAPILAAALAATELRKVTGREALTTYAVALEVERAVGKVLGHEHYFRGWHTTGTVGIFAAAAAAARLLGADIDGVCTAWGIAASQAAGLRKNFGTMTKSFHVGQAARAGLEAAWLALNGFDANPSIFDGADGFFAIYGGADGISPEQALALLGNPWCLLDPGISIKRWPCCFGAHRPLGGIFRLIEDNDIRAEDVEAVKVHFLPMSDKALTHLAPTTGMEGKFSIEYCTAAALLDREITLDSFTDEKVRRPQAQQLMSKVQRVHVPGEGSFNAHYGYTDLEILTRQGRYATRADKTPGSLALPLSKAEIRQKFVGCARLLNGQAYAEVVFEALDGLADSHDVGTLVASALGDPSQLIAGKRPAHAGA